VTLTGLIPCPDCLPGLRTPDRAYKGLTLAVDGHFDLPKIFEGDDGLGNLLCFYQKWFISESPNTGLEVGDTLFGRPVIQEELFATIEVREDDCAGVVLGVEQHDGLSVIAALTNGQLSRVSVDTTAPSNPPIWDSPVGSAPFQWQGVSSLGAVVANQRGCADGEALSGGLGTAVVTAV
jgi:hypothetical protein